MHAAVSQYQRQDVVKTEYMHSGIRGGGTSISKPTVCMAEVRQGAFGVCGLGTAIQRRVMGWWSPHEVVFVISG